ncbi:MAG: MBL fold metallo-hydrolase [Gemmatimonadales bacterium]
MRFLWIWCAVAAPVAGSAQDKWNSALDTTLVTSPAAGSMLRALPVLQRAINAVAGHREGVEALGSLSSISTDRNMLRTSTGQGMHPGVPAIEHAVLLMRMDLKASRVFTLRDLEIDGGQMWASGAFITDSGGYDFNYANRTYRTGTADQYASLRSALLRRELPTLLLSAWHRPETLRSLGVERIRGRPSDVISFADFDGSLITLYVDQANHLPVRTEVLIDDPTRGDQAVPIDYSDYRLVQGFRLPFKTYQDGPGPERWESLLTRIELNGSIPDSLFTVPQGLAPSAAGSPLTKLADGVYAMPGSAAIEFHDFVVVFEAYGSSRQSKANIARIRATFPGKPVRYVVSSHYHEDHLGGVRPYAAEGVTFLTTADAEARIVQVLAGRHVMRPDTFNVRPLKPTVERIERSRVIEDSTRRLVLYQIGPTAHVDKILIGYLPKEKILIEGDLLDIPGGKPSAGGEDTEQLAAKLRELRLQVERILPIHGTPGTLGDLDRALTMHRARSRCPQRLVERLFCDFWSSR